MPTLSQYLRVLTVFSGMLWFASAASSQSASNATPQRGASLDLNGSALPAVNPGSAL